MLRFLTCLCIATALAFAQTQRQTEFSLRDGYIVAVEVKTNRVLWKKDVRGIYFFGEKLIRIKKLLLFRYASTGGITIRSVMGIDQRNGNTLFHLRSAALLGSSGNFSIFFSEPMWAVSDEPPAIGSVQFFIYDHQNWKLKELSRQIRPRLNCAPLQSYGYNPSDYVLVGNHISIWREDKCGKFETKVRWQ